VTPAEEIRAIKTVLRLYGWHPTMTQTRFLAASHECLEYFWTDGTRCWAPPCRLDNVLYVLQTWSAWRGGGTP
jgi:hypothetical protein